MGLEESCTVTVGNVCGIEKAFLNRQVSHIQSIIAMKKCGENNPCSQLYTLGVSRPQCSLDFVISCVRFVFFF